MIINFFLRLASGLISLIFGLIFIFEILGEINIWLDVKFLKLLICLGVESRLAAPMFVQVQGFAAEDYSFTAAYVLTIILPGIAGAILLYYVRNQASIFSKLAFIALPLTSAVVSFAYLPTEKESYIKGGRYILQQVFSVSAAFFLCLAMMAIVYSASLLPELIRKQQPKNQTRTHGR